MAIFSRICTQVSAQIVAAAAILVHAAGSASAVPVTVTYSDGPDTGFNDPTLGAARQAAFEFAMNLWSQSLAGTVPIVLDAAMQSLGGTGAHALLASTLVTTVHRNFTGAPLLDTWYGAALANELSGIDLNGSDVPEIQTTFNADVDGPAVLGSVDWYYGTDAQPGADIDFVTVAFHEIGHGLNFSTFLDPRSGQWLNGTPDIYGTFLVRPGVGSFTNMLAAERLAASTSSAVFWSGAHVVAALGDEAPIYAPNPLQPGSSLTHWDVSLPRELIGPFYMGANHQPGLLLPALEDMGWGVTVATPTSAPTRPPRATPTPTPTPASSPSFTPPTKQFAYVTNFDSANVSVIDTATAQVTATIAVGDGPLGVAITPDGRFAYVANFRSGSVSVISTRTNTVTSTIDIDGACNSIAITPDGRSVYVTNTSPGTVAVIDTASETVTTTLTGFEQPGSIAMARDGAHAFVLDFGANLLAVIDTETHLLTAIVPLDFQNAAGPVAIAVAPNGTALIAAFLSHSILTFDTQQLFVDSSVFVASGAPAAIAFTRDGALAYVADPAADEVLVYDPATQLPPTVYFFVGHLPTALAFTPDGQFAYVTNAGDNTVTVLPTRSDHAGATINVGSTPMGVASARIPQSCTGDCDHNGRVTVDELLTGISIALDQARLDSCSDFDADGNHVVTIDELLTAITNALTNCQGR